MSLLTLSQNIRQPVSVIIIDDWNLAVTVRQPTISAEISSGGSISVSMIPKPSLIMSIGGGQIISLSQSIRQPSVNILIAPEAYLSVSKSIRKPRFSFVISDTTSGAITLVKAIRKPTLAILISNKAVTSTGKTYVLNTFNTAHSEYTNHNFNSYFTIGKNLYAISDTGVYLIGGESDITEQIDADVRLPISSFDKQGMKACYDAFVLGRTYGDLELQMNVDEQVINEGYYIYEDSRQGLHRIRAKVDKGLKGAVWQPIIKNVDGCNFAINNFEILLKELQRVR